MGKKKVFVSFDWENDRHRKFLLQAWDANEKFDLSFYDATSQEIDSEKVHVVKAALTRKINDATHTLVIVGAEANKKHKDHKLIGFKNWINFEISRSKNAGNKLVAVKIARTNESPEELLGAGAAWAMSFTDEAVTKALNDA
ncbi:MAG: TIR domain-containing protein [Armatimonadetes bacterium]|nr:TIR domain-containing protein [Armatimonadota bacterium]